MFDTWLRRTQASLVGLLCACVSSPPQGIAVPRQGRAGPESSAARNLEPVTVGETVFHRRLLGNGLHAVAASDSGENLTVFVVVKAGKRQETSTTTGLAHLTEHAMYTGTERMGPGQHDRRIEALGGRSNAFTREDYTVFYDDGVPRDSLAEVLAMEADRLRGLTFDPKAMLLERGRLHREEARSWNPSQKLDEQIEAEVFHVHPYGVGVLDEDGHTLAPELSISQVRDFYDRFYQPGAIAVVGAGSVEPATTLDAIERTFAGLPPGPDPEPIPREPEILVPRDVEIPSDLSADRLEWVWLVPEMGHPDRPALEVLARLLSRQTTERGTPISATMGSRVDQELFRLAATGPRAAADLARVIEKLESGEIEPAEIEKLKTLEAAAFDGQPLRSRPYFSLAATFAVYEVLGHAERLPAYGAALRRLTAEDLLRVAARYLRPERRVSIRLVGTGTELAPLPDDPGELQRKAIQASQSGDLDRAIEAYTKLLGRDINKMNRVIALASRGQVRMQQGEHALAIIDFETALEITDYPDLHTLLEEARGRQAGIQRDTDDGDEGAEAGIPDTDREPVALAARMQAAQQALEDWRGLPFLGPVESEIVERQDDKLVGWYDPGTKRLAIVTGLTQAFSHGALLHEVHHALQDQHWDLGALEQAATSSDERRALAGLIEGEAMLAVSEITGYDFEQHMHLPEKGELERARFEKLFSYGAGLRFVRALRERGGWKQVDRVWVKPPSTTSEVLHPERYPARPDSIREPAPVAGEVIEQDRLGEFEVRWLLAQDERTRSRVESIARGLSADLWRRVRAPDGSVLEVWDLRFNEARAAEAFARDGGLAARTARWSLHVDGRDVRMSRPFSPTSEPPEAAP